MHLDGTLFDLASIPTREKAKLYKNLESRVWTTTKAQFIARYLKYFVFVTKHGTYLDAFAGPQDPKKLDSWAASLVLKNRPAWLRQFHLFEKSEAKLRHLDALQKSHGAEKKRSVSVYPGNSNTNLPAYLESNPIKDKEAAFCLLDQHTFECDWKTVKAIAEHKKGGNKIEIFYFLAQGWLDRAISGLKKDKDGDLGRWWGGEGWKNWTSAPPLERPLIFSKRFRDELGYKSANYYPIFKQSSSSRIMFYLVHASDHPEAPVLMTRAYNNAMKPLEPMPQHEMAFIKDIIVRAGSRTR